MIPALMTYVQGQAVTSADNLNSLVQQCNTFADLRSFTGFTNMVVFCKGGNAINDGLGGSFYWNSTAVGTDNNSTFIVPTGSVAGAWILVPVGAMTLAGLNDVSISSPATGQVLTYNFATGKWYNANPGSSSVTTADNLTAHAGGGRGSATVISTNWARLTTVATTGDSSVMRPAISPDFSVIIQDGSNSMQLFANGSDTILSAAGSVGIQVNAGVNGSVTLLYCLTNGAWQGGSFFT
jgi:hypothetical protein